MSVNGEIRMNLCKFDGCGRPHWAKGFCSSHYGQLKAGRGLHPIGQTPYVTRGRTRGRCSFQGCDWDGILIRKTRLCTAHNNQLNATGTMKPVRWRPRVPRGSDPRVRFWAWVKKSEGCWIFQGSLNRFGYGKFQLRGRTLTAHRVAYSFEHGEVPSLLRHTCDQPACVRVSHLVPGTPAENSGDMVARRRSLKGTRNHAALLTERDVIYIRSLYARGTRTMDLASKFGVTKYAIQDAVSRRSWAHVP